MTAEIPSKRFRAGPPKRNVKKVAFIADIHDGADVVTRHLDLFNEQDVTDVVLCGDAVSPATIRAFADYQLHYVLGNGEHNHGTIRDVVKVADEIGGIIYGRDGRVQFGEKHFLIRHGDIDRDLGYAMAATNVDYTVHGHLHYQEDNEVGTGRVMNPGDDGAIIYDVAHDTFEFYTYEDVATAEDRPGYGSDDDE